MAILLLRGLKAGTPLCISTSPAFVNGSAQFGNFRVGRADVNLPTLFIYAWIRYHCLSYYWRLYRSSIGIHIARGWPPDTLDNDRRQPSAIDFWTFVTQRKWAVFSRFS